MEVSLFVKKHKYWIGSMGVGFVGLIALKRYYAGGTCDCPARLDGKLIIVTGCNVGIGKETVTLLAERGASVVMACRDILKAERAAEQISKKTGNPKVFVHQLDLSSLESVRKFSALVLQRYPRIDMLINNAGVMACPKQLTFDGFEMQFGTNHLGHFLLTNLLLDRLKTSSPSRIINVSSRAYGRGKLVFDDLFYEKREYDPFDAYSQSKLANVLFARELARRLEGTGVVACSLHPGVIVTPLWRHIMPKFYFWQHWLLNVFQSIFAKTPVQGAQTTLHCALVDDLVPGAYYSDCVIKKVTPVAQDDEAALKLWQISERLVKL